MSRFFLQGRSCLQVNRMSDRDLLILPLSLTLEVRVGVVRREVVAEAVRKFFSRTQRIDRETKSKTEIPKRRHGE